MSKFIFLNHKLDLEEGKAQFFYELETSNHKYNFVESISFPKTSNQTTNHQLLTTVLDNLLLILGVSYWKTFCPKTIETPKVKLNKQQAIFWNTLYTKGLGEFFYKNQIDFRELIKFPYTENVFTSDNEKIEIQGAKSQASKKSLVLFGGGKDSIVTAEILKNSDRNFAPFVVNPKKIHNETLAVLEKEAIFFTRKLDSKLFELNKQENVYNGHVPATAIIDFLAIFASVLYDFDYIVASNEESSNYGNVKYLDEEINHQWSKSEEFEKMLQIYIHEYINPKLTYFSLLRPLTELQITKEFVNHEKYFPYFSSCNKNFILHHAQTDTRWCGKCPKCFFVFILLSAYLSRGTLLNIFNKNLYKDYKLLPILCGLLGIDISKPFECVGTPEETISALRLALDTNQYENDILMLYVKEELAKYKEKVLDSKQVKAVTETLPADFKDLDLQI